VARIVKCRGRSNSRISNSAVPMRVYATLNRDPIAIGGSVKRRTSRIAEIHSFSLRKSAQKSKTCSSCLTISTCVLISVETPSLVGAAPAPNSHRWQYTIRDVLSYVSRA